MCKLLIVNITLFLAACAASTEISAQNNLTDKSDNYILSKSKSAQETLPKASYEKPVSQANFSFDKIINKYLSTKGAVIKIKKYVHLELLGETKISDGIIYFSNKSLRIEISQPDPSLIILNSNTIWIVVPANKELNSKAQVTKISTNNNQTRSRAPLAYLLIDRKLWNNFLVKSEKKLSENQFKTTLVPINNKVISDISEITVKFDIKRNEFDEISYTDDIGNVTTYNFIDSNFSMQPEKKLFVYKPTKNDEVTVFE